VVDTSDVLAVRATDKPTVHGHTVTGGERLEIAQDKCRKACSKYTALAAARQRFNLKRPVEVLAKLADHSDPAFWHKQQAIVNFHAEGPDV